LLGQNEYEGQIVKINKANTAGLYIVRWIDGAYGVGFMDGNCFVSSYIKGSQTGCVRFHIGLDDKGKPKLSGKWISNPGTGEVNEENLSWLKGGK